MRGVVALVAAVVVALSAGVAHASAAATRKAPGPARALASAVTGARTDAGRRAALLRTFKTLGIGVYTSRGRAIVHGRERRNRDLYLYDEEVRALAAAIGRGDRVTVTDVAGLFTKIGVRVSPATLATVIRLGAAGSARHPGLRASLVPLLARELGLRDRPAVDIAKAVTPDTKLDPLQAFLVEASLLGPIPRRAAGGRIPSSVSGCPEVREPEEKPPTQIGDAALSWWAMKEWKKKAGELSGTLKKGFQVKKLVDNVIYGLHGSLLAYSLKVSRVSNDFHTHYGPAGHRPDAGAQLRFGIKVEMLDDLGDETIDCLALAGIKLPKKGPVKDVPIRFSQTEGADLRKRGTLEPAMGLLGAVAKTGADGIAWLTFTPKNEAVPGRGKEIVEHGNVDALAEWANAFGNKLGKVNQYLTPKFDVMGWDVGFHEQWVFDATFEGTQTTDFYYRQTYDPLLTCFANSTTQGTETLRVPQSPPTRIVFYEGFDGRLAPYPADGFVSPVPMTVPGTVERNSSYTYSTNGKPCAGGGGGGGSPPPPDCGMKPYAFVVGLGWAPDSIDIRDENAENDDPFHQCPGGGRYSLRFMGGSASFPAADVKDESKGAFSFPLADSKSVDETNSFTSGSGQWQTTATSVERSTTTFNGTLRLTRVNP